MATKAWVSTEEEVWERVVLGSQPATGPHQIHLQPQCLGAGGWPPGEQVAPWGPGQRGPLQRFPEPPGPPVSSGQMCSGPLAPEQLGVGQQHLWEKWVSL